MRRVGLAVAVVALCACSSNGPDTPAGVLRLSTPAPPISGPYLTGGSGWFDRADYEGRELVVNFFNPYCPPCREEQPVLEADWRRLGDRGVRFLGVHYVGGQWPPSVEAARSYLRREGVTYPVLEDPESNLVRSLGIQGIPSTVVIDRRGRIRLRILGRVKPGELTDLLDRLSSASD